MLRKLMILPLLLLAGACTGRVAVPPVVVDIPTGFTPMAGNYAAMVQSGGWALKVDTNAWTCSAWDFDTNINDAYADAAQQVLKKSLENVVFVPTTLSAEQLAAHGFDAQIILYQGNASSRFGVAAGFFAGTANSEVALTTTLAILDNQGLVYQHSLTGKGTGYAEVFTCNTIGEAISIAAQDAIRDITKDVSLYVRDGLRERIARRNRTSDAALVPKQ